jgi:prepilin-type N-terminal cleavage/methylation domain-containing protein
LTAIDSARARADWRAGFTLIETLAALAIAAALMAVVAQIAGQALRNWNRGEGTIAAMEMLTRGLNRMAVDLSVALPMRLPGSDGTAVLFQGDASNILFVAATGFGAGNRGVELISISAVPERDGSLVVRQRGPVASRLQVRFSYRERNGQTVPVWSGRPDLPAAVHVEIYGADASPVFPVPMILTLPADLAADCLSSEESDGAEKRCPNAAAQTADDEQQNRAGARR